MKHKHEAPPQVKRKQIAQKPTNEVVTNYYEFDASSPKHKKINKNKKNTNCAIRFFFFFCKT